jgi:membrane fusion protein (multidrug efflux system)
LHWRWPWASPERLTSANRDFQTALDHAHADVTASDATVRNLDAQLALQQPVIERNPPISPRKTLKLAQEQQIRYDGLMKTSCGTIQRAQQTDAALGEKIAQLQHGKSGRSRPRGRSTFSPSNEPRLPSQLDRARAVDQQMALNLSYTTIAALVDGTIGAGWTFRASRNATDGSRPAQCDPCGGEISRKLSRASSSAAG